MIRRRLAHTLDRRFESVHHRVEGLSGDVARLREDVAAVARLDQWWSRDDMTDADGG